MIFGYARFRRTARAWRYRVQITRRRSREDFLRVASGAKSDRPQLGRLPRQLNAGDVLMVTRLDRLARSTRDLLNVMAQIDAKAARFRSLATLGRHDDPARAADFDCAWRLGGI